MLFLEALIVGDAWRMRMHLHYLSSSDAVNPARRCASIRAVQATTSSNRRMKLFPTFRHVHCSDDRKLARARLCRAIVVVLWPVARAFGTANDDTPRSRLRGHSRSISSSDGTNDDDEVKLRGHRCYIVERAERILSVLGR